MSFRNIFAAADVVILSHLGEDATLDGVAVRGELSTQVDQVNLSGGLMGFQGEFFRLPDSQAAGAVIDSTLAVLGKTYKVVNIVPEGTGVTALALRLES